MKYLYDNFSQLYHNKDLSHIKTYNILSRWLWPYFWEELARLSALLIYQRLARRRGGLLQVCEMGTGRYSHQCWDKYQLQVGWTKFPNHSIRLSLARFTYQNSYQVPYNTYYYSAKTLSPSIQNTQPDHTEYKQGLDDLCGCKGRQAPASPPMRWSESTEEIYFEEGKQARSAGSRLGLNP